MFIPATQRKLLREILDGFCLARPVDDVTLGAIYTYLFSRLGKLITFPDPDLLIAVSALRDIVAMEQLTSLEGIVRFFDTEARRIDEYKLTIKEEIELAVTSWEDEEDEQAFENAGCSETMIGVRPALSRYVVSSDRDKKREFMEAFIHQTPYLNRFFAVKLRQLPVVPTTSVQDLIQQSILLAWEAYRKSMADQHALVALIRKTAKNVLQAHVSKLRKEIKTVPLEKAIWEIPEFPYEKPLEIKDFHKLLKESLCDREYIIVELYLRGLSHREIARTLQITEYSVRTIYLWSIKRVKKQFGMFKNYYK